MTVTYSLEVSTTQLAGFGKLLLRWRGSIYKLIYRELIIFTVAYYAIAMLYRLVLVRYENHKKNFESLSLYFRDFSGLIPMTFVMGFYVWLIIARWWSQYLNLPWPDRVVMAITTFIQGQDERGRMIRRTLARYLNIMAVLTLQAISTSVKKRFPTMDHLIEAGILLEEERAFIDSTASPHGNWFQPAIWFSNLAMQARKEGRIHDDIHLKTILDEMMSYRGCCGMLYSYDWISVPLAYTQVVTLAVYSFFAASLIGRQFLLLPPGEMHSYILDEYIPLFTFIQFFFYMGWLKTAEELINPLGDDEDDFELNYLIDRNVQVGCLIADDMHKKYPKLQKDPFWDEPEPEIPYTAAAAETHRRPFLGSVVDLNIRLADSEWQALPAISPLKEMSIHSRVSRDSVASSGTDVGGRPDGKMHHQLSPNAPSGLRRLLPDHTKVIRGSMHSLREAHRRRRSRFAGNRLLGIRINGAGNSVASSRSVSHTGSRLGSQVSLNSSINHSFEAINNGALMSGGPGVEHRRKSNSNYQISSSNKLESSERKSSKPQLFSFTKSSVDIIGKPIEDVGEFPNDTLYPPERLGEEHVLPASPNVYLSPPSYEAAIQSDQAVVAMSPNVMGGLPISEPVVSNISGICTPFFDAGSSLPPLEPIDEGCVFTVSTTKSPIISRPPFQAVEVFSNDLLVGSSEIVDGSGAGTVPLDASASLITIEDNLRVAAGATRAYISSSILTPSPAAPVFMTVTPFPKPILSPLSTSLAPQTSYLDAASPVPTSSMPQLPSPLTDGPQSFAAGSANDGNDASLPLLSPLKPQRKASAPEPLQNASSIEFTAAGDEKTWLLISEKVGEENNGQLTASGDLNHDQGVGIIVLGGNQPPSEGSEVVLDATAVPAASATSSMPWDAVSDSDSHTPLIPISSDSVSLESIAERGGNKSYGDLGQEAAGVG